METEMESRGKGDVIVLVGIVLGLISLIPISNFYVQHVNAEAIATYCGHNPFRVDDNCIENAIAELGRRAGSKCDASTPFPPEGVSPCVATALIQSADPYLCDRESNLCSYWANFVLTQQKTAEPNSEFLSQNACVTLRSSTQKSFRDNSYNECVANVGKVHNTPEQVQANLAFCNSVGSNAGSTFFDAYAQEKCRLAADTTLVPSKDYCAMRAFETHSLKDYNDPSLSDLYECLHSPGLKPFPYTIYFSDALPSPENVMFMADNNASFKPPYPATTWYASYHKVFKTPQDPYGEGIFATVKESSVQGPPSQELYQEFQTVQNGTYKTNNNPATPQGTVTSTKINGISVYYVQPTPGAKSSENYYLFTKGDTIIKFEYDTRFYSEQEAKRYVTTLVAAEPYFK